MLKKYFHCFLGGTICGFVLGIFLFDESATVKHTNFVKTSSNATEEKTALADLKKIRILCMLNTSPKNHHKRAVHIRKTWGKHCDKLIFASTLTDVNLNAIGFNMTDNHAYVFGKQKLMMQYVHNNFLNKFDWFYKADDDTFAVIENLRFLLSAYSPEDPIFFGYKFFTPLHRWGYFSGGAGYVMSKRALREFVEKSLRNESICPQIGMDKISEDWNVPQCLARLNVLAGDSRDPLARERFLMGPPRRHLFDESKPWYWNRKYYGNKEGLNCCSNYTISFHYIYARQMYTKYFLTHLLSVYGIKQRYPPIPPKQDIAEVNRILEMDRIKMMKRKSWERYNRF